VSRRALTLLLASALALGLAIAGSAQGVPYVALSAGPAYNTLGSVDGKQILTITGRPTYPTDGALDLTTVSVRDRISLFQAITGWLSSRQAVVPREVVFPPDQTQEQTDQQNQQQMQESQDDATTAALRQLGLPSTTTVTVSSVAKGAPADGRLKPGDVLTAVDGTAVTGNESLRALISKHAPGEPVVIAYTRDGQPGTATLVTAASTEGPRRAIVGITPNERSVFPVKVDIMLKDVGGPSAGLMFALGIIDKLGPESRHRPEDARGAGPRGHGVPRPRRELRRGTRHPAGRADPREGRHAEGRAGGAADAPRRRHAAVVLISPLLQGLRS
jgi:PDZ domain-containing protein